jgi:hypothetical protein
MATISRTGIAGGSTISPTHITNIIDALDGTGIGITVVATGSFTGSLVGNATTANTATSASYALNATTASYALNAGGGGSSFPYTGSAIISGSLLVTGSLNVSGSIGVVGTTTLTGSINVNQTNITHTVNGTIVGNSSLILNLRDVGKTPFSGSFVLPNFIPGAPSEGTIYWDVSTRTLNVYSVAAGWTTFNA